MCGKCHHLFGFNLLPSPLIRSSMMMMIQVMSCPKLNVIFQKVPSIQKMDYMERVLSRLYSRKYSSARYIRSKAVSRNSMITRSASFLLSELKVLLHGVSSVSGVKHVK